MPFFDTLAFPAAQKDFFSLDETGELFISLFPLKTHSFKKNESKDLKLEKLPTKIYHSHLERISETI